MKLYISADMEGLTGVTNFLEVKRDEKDYSRFRKIMTQEVNAAIEGAMEAGVNEVLINDGHANMRNLLLEELHPNVKLISGSLKPLSQMQGVDETFDAAFFIGYHSMSGTKEGVRAHTYADEIYAIYINDLKVGELGMNAAYAGALGVPVVLISGDDKLAQEARNLLGEVETVIVKEGISVDSGKHLPLTKSKELIRKGAKRAIENMHRYSSFQVSEPGEIKLVFKHTKTAHLMANLPYFDRKDGYTITMTFNKYLIGYKNMIGALKLLFARI